MSKTFYATFQGGKVVLDEPSPQIPEGKRLKLVVPDNDTELEEEDDSMDEEERAELDAFLAKSMESAKAGKTITHEEMMQRLAKLP
jgi:hypothetical protein